MLVPVKWLKQYIDLDADSRLIADKLTDSGSHVESIKSLDEGITNIKVAKVENIKEHESLKKLLLVDLNLGDEEITLVTGAKNMKVGDLVVAALEGANLPGGITIGEADFDGVKSKGMLLSYEELGYSDSLVPKNSKDGIIILTGDYKPGDCGIKALDLDDQVIEFEITPNRPDCLSIIGMAREAGASFEKTIEEPKNRVDSEVDKIEDYFNGLHIETEKTDRFILRVIKDVEIKESPQWMKNDLMKAGMRPINNIVDITNFIMLEYGQPLHAYDLDKIREKALIVRDAKDGEQLLTLDKNTRSLTSEDIVICDGKSNPIGLAGVMGGFDTEVTESTTNILIEAATFEDDSIRQTSKRLNLRSEASSRYEKKVPSKLAEVAIDRFCELIEATSSGIVVAGSYDHKKDQIEDRTLRLRNSRSNTLLGLDLDINQTRAYLENLGLETSIEGDEIITKIPYYREDLTIEADLIEEVGRLYGFHNIKPQPLKGALTEGLKSDLRNFMDQVRRDVFALGFSEILTYSFISEKQFDNLNLDKESKLRNVIKILNPLGEDFSVMRTTLLGNMLDVIRRNINNKENDLKLSELGNTFSLNDSNERIETKLLTLGLVGDYDFYYTKDIVLNLLDKYGVNEIEFEKNDQNSIYHPGRCAHIIVDGQDIGTIGEIHPLVLENFDIGKRVYAAELNIDLLITKKADQIRYQTVSKYPMVERDIALVVDKAVESQKIIDVIKDNGGQLLKSVQLFDIYTGSQIEEGKKSLAYKIGFQSDERTLKDKEVKAAFENILAALSDAFGVNLRG